MIPPATLPPRRVALAAALLPVLLGLGACDRAKPAPRPEAGPSVFDAPPPGPEGAPGLIQAQVLVDGPFITALSGGHVARLPLEPAWRYAWAIEGGRILEGGESNEARYEAGAAGVVVVRCRITGPGGASLLTTAQQTIVAAPEIQAFDAVPPALPEGGKGRLSWTVRQAAKLTLDPGGRDVLQEPSVEIAPAGPTTYRLTATNLAGTTVTRERLVAILPPPRILAFTWEGTRKSGEPLNLKAEFQGGRAEIREGETVIGSSTESPLVVTVTPKVGSAYTLRVSNDTGASSTQTLTASARPTP